MLHGTCFRLVRGMGTETWYATYSESDMIEYIYIIFNSNNSIQKLLKEKEKKFNKKKEEKQPINQAVQI